MMTAKRPRTKGPSSPTSPENPYLDMFTFFRDELDEHHDRRERVIKTSRDVTALSKKMYTARPVCAAPV